MKTLLFAAALSTGLLTANFASASVPQDKTPMSQDQGKKKHEHKAKGEHMDKKTDKKSESKMAKPAEKPMATTPKAAPAKPAPAPAKK